MHEGITFDFSLKIDQYIDHDPNQEKTKKVNVEPKDDDGAPQINQLDISLDLPGNFKLGNQRIIDLIKDNN